MESDKIIQINSELSHKRNQSLQGKTQENSKIP